MTFKRAVPLSEYHRLPQEAPDADVYKRLLEVVCNNATVALFIMDERQQCIYMNPAAEVLTGYSLTETRGRALHDVIHHTRPDGRPYPLCECPIDQAFPQNNQEQGEEIFVHKDGHFYLVAYTASPIREGDSVIGTIIEVRDISQEKLAEQARQEAEHREQALQAEAKSTQRQLTHLLEHMGDAFIMLDHEWRIVYQNAEAERLNQKPRAEVLGKTHWEEWPASVGTNVEAQYRRAMAEQVAVHIEHHYYVPPTYDYWLEIHAYPLEDGLGIFYRDINERKQAEKDLRESERRFRRLVESNMFGVAFGDFAGGMHYANDYFLNMVDYTREEVESGQMQWMTITPPEFLPLDEAAGEELKTKGVSTPFEKEYIRKDGTRVPILIGATLLDEPYEQAQEIIAFYLDLTERKQVEAAWREGKQTLDAIMEYMPEGITIADAPDVKIRQVSKYGQQLTGRPQELITDIPASSHVERWGLLRPDGTQPTGEELPLTRAVLQAEMVTDEEWVLQRPDGSQINILCNAGPIRDQANTTTGGLMAWRDITERKQFETALWQALQKLNFHVENTPMAVIELDGTLMVTRWSGAAEKIFGWTSLEVLGKSLADLDMVVEDDIDKVAETSQRLISGKEPYVFSYNRNYTKDGDVIHCEWYNSSLHDESGQMLSVLSLVLDVTDAKRAEAQREELLVREQAARHAAEAANRIKDEFLAIVSHELRSPLNPILGWSRILRQHQLDEQKTKHALEVIERNAQMQAQLINDLLDVSRILRGQLSLNAAPVDLASTIQAAIETVRLAAEAKSITIHTLLAPGVGSVWGDASRVQQVMWNLLSNAVKFTPEGGQVTICLTLTDTQAQITVSDTGKGISPDFLPYVFDHFRQESATSTRQFGGLGLGLAIVRYLVEQHGGTVLAESPGEGQGATFTIKIPLMVNQPAADQAINLPEPDLDLQDIKILVVEDNDSSREFLVFLLELHRADVVAVATAGEALTAIAQFKPNLLLSDIGLPHVDGYMLMRQIRALPLEQGGGIPAIALTAFVGEVDYQRATTAGFQRHLAKPVEPELLIQTILELRRISAV